MLHTSPLQTLLILTGPVGGGKSTTAAALCANLRSNAHSTAHIELDVVYCMVRSTHNFDDQGLWVSVRRAAGALAASFLASGVNTVVVDGSFFTPSEHDDLLQGLGTTTIRRVAVTLLASWEAAQRRIALDPDPARVASRDPEFLRTLHAPFVAALPWLRQSSYVIDTETLIQPAIVASIAGLIAAPASMP